MIYSFVLFSYVCKLINILLTKPLFLMLLLSTKLSWRISFSKFSKFLLQLVNAAEMQQGLKKRLRASWQKEKEKSKK